MSPSLKALLSGAIDYAGLFPPAKLPLEEAFRNYLRYRAEPESWMLGRFICPAGRLAELVPLRKEIRGAPSPPVLSVTRGGYSLTEAECRDEWASMKIFLKRLGNSVVIDSFENRLPKPLSLLIDLESLRMANEVMPKFTPRRPVAIHYLELIVESDWRKTITNDLALLMASNQLAVETGRVGARSGVKLRCGGMDAAAFPSPDVVAFVIATCSAHCVPLKFTAGLHHPVRRFDSALNTHMHGFLNVFVAGVLAHARGVREDILREVLVDEKAEDFAFDEDGLQWREYTATLAEIEAARAKLVKSFGSCSFDEPREDLRELRLL
jgi:hypothetical protein